MSDSENFAQPEEQLGEALDAELEEVFAETDPDVDGDGEVTSLEAQLAERTEDLQRITAEYANYRRRTQVEKQQVIEVAKAGVLTQLLPVLDDLELADKHGDIAEGSPLRAFRDKLVGITEGLKLTPFGAEGDVFDAERHEAVQDLSQGEEKVIGTVLRRGYQVEERLVRTAMVIIADPAPVEEPSVG